MPPLGKSQPEGARKPFNLADHSYGEQVDAVRLKIASLMDGVTENEEQQRAVIDQRENGASEARPETLRYDQPSLDQPHAKQHQNGTQFNQEPIGEGERSAGPKPQQSFTTPTPPVDFGAHNGNDGYSNADWAREQDERTRQMRSVGPTVESVATDAQLKNDEQKGERAWQTRYDDEPSEWPRRPGQSVPPAGERNFHAGWDDAGQPPASATENSGRAIHADPPLFRETASGDEGNKWRTDEVPTTTASTKRTVESTRHNAAANHIHIKGRAGGILIEIGKGEWPVLMAALADRLAGAANFFRNGSAAVELADRVLTEPDLAQLHQLLKEQSLELVLIRTLSQETFQSALDMGLSAQLETTEGDTTATAQPALSNLLQEQHFIYTGHLRAGQILQRREHILILGDVNPGATVISDGDILVWGHLRGIAHAGAADGRGIICALNLAPVQLRIGDFIAIAPAPEKPKRVWGRQQPTVKQPELAYLAGDRINVEPWDATKFGGIAAFRRQK